jgi:hypothetical protein
MIAFRMPLARHRQIFALLSVATLVLPVSVGCGRVRQAHWVDGPFANEIHDDAVRGFYYDAFDLAPGAAEAMLGKTLRVEVEPTTRTFVAERCRITKEVDWEGARRRFEDHLADRLYQSQVFADVSTPADSRPLTRPELILRIAITEYHEGNAFLRYVPGFGAGATRVQWEGEMVACDRATGPDEGADAGERRILAFADARLHPGGPSMGISTKPYDGQALIAEDLGLAIEGLVDDLRRLTHTEEPMRRGFYRHPQGGITRAMSEAGTHPDASASARPDPDR